MKKFKRVICLLGLTLVYHNIAKPISEDDAVWWGEVAGIGVATTGVTIGIGTAVSSQGDSDSLLLGALIGVGGLGLGALSGYALYRILLEYTPLRKFERAKELIDEVASDSLMERTFDYVENFVSHINFRFGTNYPLVLARDRFKELMSKVNEASILLHSAYDEASKDVTLIDVCNKCVEENERVEYASNLIEQRTAVILKCTDYNHQVDLYEIHKREQKRLEEKRWKRANERWHKQMLHDEKMRQKERDRRQKQEFLDRVDAQQVGVNVNL
jgi:hypothetical protein